MLSALGVFAVVGLASGLASDTAAAAEPTALETFRASQKAVVKLVQKKAPTAKLKQEVDKLLDYKWIAQAALGGPRSYDKKCAPRCSEYEQLLGELIRENYLKRVRQADKGSVEYLGEEVRNDKAKVDTRVRFDKDGTEQDLNVSYIMHRVDGHWIARNIITDGVRLSKTYRHEFSKLHRSGGIDRVIEQLKAKVAEVASASK